MRKSPAVQIYSPQSRKVKAYPEAGFTAFPFSFLILDTTNTKLREETRDNAIRHSSRAAWLTLLNGTTSAQ